MPWCSIIRWMIEVLSWNAVADCSNGVCWRLLASSSTASSLVLSVHTGSAGRSSNDVQRLLAEGWFHANSDAGCRIADGSATCGGVIRNHDVNVEFLILSLDINIQESLITK
ncbi:hypothetical protein V6N11_032276 [Hibiscus sabdariffa]|uniref:Secreted protein n=1 Tax=Hibiscus sabdariffa TaxID=183260 RepID=A0ABR2T063_9ROSI